jgi:hypothetical protein
MMEQQTIGRDTFRVGGYRCCITLANGGIKTEWTPCLPDQLNEQEWREYRAGRDAFMAAAFPDKNIAIIEA